MAASTPARAIGVGSLIGGRYEILDLRAYFSTDSATGRTSHGDTAIELVDR